MKPLLPILLAAGLLTTLASSPLPARAADDKAPVGQRDLNTILVESRLKRMNTELTLSEEQKGKLRPLISEEIKFLHGLRENDKLTEDDRIKQQNEYRETAKPKYKAILSEEQYPKWLKMFEKKPKKPKA